MDQASGRRGLCGNWSADFDWKVLKEELRARCPRTADKMSALQMPQTRHTERHFTAGGNGRRHVVGLADGLTVPFALAAGLTGAIDSAGIIVTAGLAEIAAGAIAMGLGGYLAAKSDAEHYAKERDRENREVVEIPEEEKREVAQVFHSYG